MTAPAAPPRDYAGLWSLAGQSLIVVGAGSGMGLETSRALAQLGARVLVVDREADLAQRAADEVGGVPLVADATEAAGIAAAIDAALAAFGRIDGAVDIVGGATRSLVDDLTPERWARDFRVNVEHAYHLGHLLGPRLAAQGGGSLTFIASCSAGHGSYVTPAYAAAKAALVNWVKTLAITYGHAGVRANTVSPGVTFSERMNRVMGEAGVATFRATTALKVINEASDVAAAIAFLVSPAARTITGIDLVVDGGTEAREPHYGDPVTSRLAEDLVGPGRG